MQPIKLTSPTTGIDFKAMRTSDGNVLFQNPLDGSVSEMVYDAKDNSYTLDAGLFEFVEIVPVKSAGAILDVSRSRVAAIMESGVIPYFKAHGCKFFVKSDLEEYMRKRKKGRPAKGVKNGSSNS